MKCYWIACLNGRLKVGVNRYKIVTVNGSGGDPVGRAVASNTRDPQFESCHSQNFINQLYNHSIEMTKIKKKWPGMVHL